MVRRATIPRQAQSLRTLWQSRPVTHCRTGKSTRISSGPLLSCFFAAILDLVTTRVDTPDMPSARTTRRNVAGIVRQRIDDGGDRIWRLADFPDLPFAAVAQALSRLARGGQIQRLSKGLYHRPRSTAFGVSRPNPASLQALARTKAPVFPAGLAAANLLGFSSQSSRHAEVATTATSLPRKLMGDDTIIHTRRPTAWRGLSSADAALLDFLRHSGSTSELSPAATTQRTLSLLAGDERFRRLLRVASTEPPRVRAMLGALGDALAVAPASLANLRRSLNPLSKFEFGPFASLPTARAWQAKFHGAA